jgi:large subunit ribosomal protein L5
LPTLEKITVHTFVRSAGTNSAYLHVAGMVLQAITNVRCQVHSAKRSIAEFNLRKGKAMAVSCELTGEDAWHFLSKVVELVMPRIKDFSGVSGGSGDGSGNLAWGFGKEVVGMFPEVEVNYDS